VEYTLSVLRCKPRKLSDAEKAVVEAAESIDTKYPRQTADEVLAFLTKIQKGNAGEAAPGVDGEAVNELG
jgi:retron-type reverse transcriptase